MPVRSPCASVQKQPAVRSGRWLARVSKQRTNHVESDERRDGSFGSSNAMKRSYRAGGTTGARTPHSAQSIMPHVES